MKRMRILIPLLGLLIGATGTTFSDLFRASEDLSALRAYPNPWRSNQHSAYPMTFDRLPTDGVSSVRIFTISGELVRSLAGTASVQWDLRNDSGERVASGIYIYLVTVNNEHRTGKIAVIR